MFGITTHSAIDAENMRGEGSAICHPSAAIRREALVAIGGYRKEFEWAEDLDLFLRLAEVGKLANLSDVLLTHRQQLTSVSYSKRGLQLTRTARAVEAAKQRRSLRCTAQSQMGGADAVEVGDGEGIDLQSDYGSTAAIHRKWAWLSLIGGNTRTARKHAFLAFRANPLDIENLRVLTCALRGY